MKFSKKKLLSSFAPIIVAVPSVLVVSCSSGATNFSLASNPSLYSTMWNLSSVFDIVKNSIFDFTIEQLENQINKSLKSDSKNNKIMKIYSFYLLWQSIKNPISESGSTITNLSPEITSFSSFLSEKLSPDISNVSDSDKTYKKFDEYVNKFDYKISLLNFKNGQLDNKQTLREVFSSSVYVLNFKIDFWTTDEDTNTKMISTTSKKPIMYKNSLTREQREKINSIPDPYLKDLTTKQFNYQSTKLYYDAENKKFSTIILPSNVYTNMTSETPDSGFSSSDKTRQLFELDWYAQSENSNSFDSYINVLLDSSSNFNVSLNSDWSRYLEQQEVLETDSNERKLSRVKVNLNKKVNIDLSEYTDSL